MSGGGGGSGNDGSNDMQVSGMEAAMSKEKGISTYSESRVCDIPKSEAIPTVEVSGPLS